ncbi:transposase [Mesorhizobium sp. M0871]|uniref:transposase n=1 Tax=unclassified Mesorhizobium TaxID=325217 RepID=UPI003338C023
MLVSIRRSRRTCQCRARCSTSRGRSSRKLQSEFGILRKRYWSQHRWARGYWVVSCGM